MKKLWLIPIAVGCLLAVAGLVALVSRGPSTIAGGLPKTSDYHSLLVAPGDANTLVLGTHDGLYRSSDGGVNWETAELDGQDAMNLVRPTADTVWAAGHNVLTTSDDGGLTWRDVRSPDLPSLDVHGFAVDPRDPNRLYAAIAGQGLYRSTDAGASFELVSNVVGPGVMALAVLPDGRLLAGDMQQQMIAASANDGKDWEKVLQAQVIGLAVHPKDPNLILASGEAVLRSGDGGRTWKQVLSLDAGSGPVAWSASDPRVAYVVGFDRSLWRSDTAGKTWTRVSNGEES